ncbi:MAG TPA: hypothetical protein VE604_12220 [Candidatus Polarisedimenticolia bacterium]|nr:hypothetical protein [Candidatus Polarisedimenticolia bacterium]
MKHRFSGLRTLWMSGLWVTLAVTMEASESNFHGLMLDCCLPSRRLAGRALEDEVLPRKTVSQQVWQISKFLNFVL